MFHNRVLAIIVGIAAAMCCRAEGTNDAFEIINAPYHVDPKLKSDESDGFIAVLTRKSQTRLEHRIDDSLSIYNFVYSTDMLSPDDQGPIQSKVMINSWLDSAKEMALDTALVDDSKNYFTRFLRGSLGNTDEEQVTLGNAALQYREKSWWKRVKDEGSLQYGIRPFQTSPYAYVSTKIRSHGEDILFTHLRYHFDSFQAHKVEALIAVPLMYNMQFETGLTYMSSGVELRDPEQKFAWTAKLEKVLHRGTFLAAAFAGVEANDRLMIVSGMRGSW